MGEESAGCEEPEKSGESDRYEGIDESETPDSRYSRAGDEEDSIYGSAT